MQCTLMVGNCKFRSPRVNMSIRNVSIPNFMAKFTFKPHCNNHYRTSASCKSSSTYLTN